MARFKALRSPKQITSYKEITYRAHGGFAEIDDKEAVEAFRKNPNWEEVKAEKKPEPKLEKKPEAPKPAPKKKAAPKKTED